MRKLINDEAGFIISAELALVLTIGVLGMVVGLASLRDSVVSEMCDLSSAFGALDQSYNFRTIEKHSSDCDPAMKAHGKAWGAGYADKADDCDCIPVTYHAVCGKPQVGDGADNEGNL